MKSKHENKTITAKKASLERVLQKNEGIKRSVKKSAGELADVNDLLEQKKVNVQVIKQALTQNEGVEYKVTKAANDLKLVNTQLANEISERIGIESELADTKTDLAEAQQSSLQDALTGLPNRVSFAQGLSRGLTQAKRHGWGLAVLFIDIDKFKSINDSYGHEMGDQVLLKVASCLKSFVRDEDMVSRWGGDEFVCLIMEVKQESDVVHLAENMIRLLAEPFEIDGHVHSILASIGIAMYPEDGDASDILFKNADAAMYKAKGTEKRVVLFRDSIEAETR